MKLKKGHKFHDGTEVKAKNFVDAWNYAAYGPNAQGGGYFMGPIEGYADVQCAGADEPRRPVRGLQPKAKEMTGLKVVDDYTFTIKTTEKVSNLPVRLGYSAFAPLPDVFFTDPKAFGDKPIGSGPFKLDTWTKEQSMELSKFADYSGDFPAKLDKVTFKIYQDPDAAYNDVLANNLDITDSIPPSALIDDKYKTDLPDRNAQKEAGVIDLRRGRRAKVDPNCADPRIARPSRWRSTATRSSSRSSTVRACRPPDGSPRSSTATRPTSAVSPASSTPRRPRRCSRRPAGGRATS